jgi:hypothetical protein
MVTLAQMAASADGLAFCGSPLRVPVLPNLRAGGCINELAVRNIKALTGEFVKICYALVFVLSPFTGASVAVTPSYSITAHIVSTGTSVHAASVCFGLDAVIAEPIAGFSSGGTYNLSVGFGHAVPTISDTIFANRFEDCSQ